MIEIIDGFSVFKNVPVDDRATMSTIALRDAIDVNVRYWGMLVVVTEDAISSNNTVYTLKRGHADNNLSNNANWDGIAAGGGHIIRSGAVDLTQREALNFTGLSVEDDSANGETDIEANIETLADVDPAGKQDGDVWSYNSTSEKTEPAATAPFTDLLRSSDANISANGKLSTFLPAGYRIGSIVITEDSGNAAGNISIGTAALGTQIVNAETVASDADLKATIVSDYQSKVNDTDLYISSSAWGSGVVSIYFSFIKI